MSMRNGNRLCFVTVRSILLLATVVVARPTQGATGAAEQCGAGPELGCSIPYLVQIVVMPQATAAFTKACVRHDYCYRHGSCTYRKTKAQCDQDMLEQMKDICLEPENLLLYPQCAADAATIYAALRNAPQAAAAFKAAGGCTICHYLGIPRIDAVAQVGSALVAAFYRPASGKSWGAYSSPDGTDLAGGGKTKRVYGNTPSEALRVDRMIPYQNGVITAFYNPSGGSGGGIYLSPDGNNLGGGGNTKLAYTRPAGMLRVDAMIPYQNGVVTAFYNPSGGSGGGIYFSPDGNNLGGGGNTRRVGSSGVRVDALLSYGKGLLTAFYSHRSGDSWGVYLSPDGQNLAGGGSTTRVTPPGLP
jgi:hypothetical protein